jgi:hypothetical protein
MMAKITDEWLKQRRNTQQPGGQKKPLREGAKINAHRKTWP